MVSVVDDDALVRKALTAAHTVLVAADGAQALDLLEEDPPDLTLLDWDMPVLDGWGFVRAFYARGGTVPIVVLSTTDARCAAPDLLVEDRLTKPVGMPELLAAVSRWCRPHGAGLAGRVGIGSGDG